MTSMFGSGAIQPGFLFTQAFDFALYLGAYLVQIFLALLRVGMEFGKLRAQGFAALHGAHGVSLYRLCRE